jgi:hypothetical protein
MREFREVALFSVAMALSAQTAGCRACAKDHPYVPPATEPPGASVTDAAASMEAGASPVSPRVYVAPSGTTKWKVGDLALDAEGRELVLAMLFDADGDGIQDALYVARPTPEQQRPGAPAGELWFIRGGLPSPRTVSLATGSSFSENPACTPLARLEPMGTVGAWVELGTACPGGGGSRAVFIVRTGKPAPIVVFDATVHDPQGVPKLELSGELRDRDQDGVDDVTLRVRLDDASVPESQRPALQLAYFDRPAGLSRDPDEPEASLRAIAGQAAEFAGKAKEAALAATLVRHARELFRVLCYDGGAPRFSKIRGVPPPACGPSRALEDLAVADVRAAVTQGDALRAFAAFRDADAGPVVRSPGKTLEMQKLLAEVAPSRVVKDVKAISVERSGAAPPGASWGPLSFDAAQQLFVSALGQVHRIDPATGALEPSDLAPWPTEVGWAEAGLRWLGVQQPCDGGAVRASFAATGSSEVLDVALPMTPRLGRACTGGSAETIEAHPLGWGPRGLTLLVGGRPLLVQPSPPGVTVLSSLTDGPSPPGSPRSQGGKSLVMPTPAGLLLRGRLPNGRWMLLRSRELEPYAELSRCVVREDASLVACPRHSRVVLVSTPER